VWTTDAKFPFAREATNAPASDATAETLLSQMRANGVAKAVVVQVSHYRWDHAYLVHALRRHPQAFVGVARVDPEDPAAPDQLAALVEAHELRGLRLNCQADRAGDFIRGPLMPALWRRCRELGVVMAVQTKHPRLRDIAPLVEKFPELTVVVDHFADTPVEPPGALDELLAWSRYPRVYLKITHPWWVSRQPYPYADGLAQVKRVYDRFGPRRLMWGSDWPIVEQKCAYAQALALVRDELAFLNPEDKRWILGETAAHVWRLD
jgi:predicted TIM-barrel fold metal-dependent hydrolase